MYGAIRDKRGNGLIELKSVMEGRLAKIEGDDLQRAELASHDHTFHEIWHYELWWDKKEKFFYDFLTSEWRVDGVS